MNTALRHWWRGRGKSERFDLYTRWSLYLLSASQPLFVVSVLRIERLGPAAWAVVGPSVVHAALCVLLVRAGLDHYLGRRPRPVALIVAAGGVAAVLLAVSQVLLRRVEPPLEAVEPVMSGLIVFGLPYLAALSTALPVRQLGLVSAGVTLLGAGMGWRVGGTPGAVGVAAGVGFGLLGVVGAYHGSAWMLSVVWELDRTRELQAQLAVAQERLRFSRDLHDVVGRNLSVVAVKSELAAQLAKRGRPEAVDEMLAVRGIAQQSLAELREVVRGYRTVELETELAGARSVLASAGVECRVVGDGAGLPTEAQNALGWAVREGVTNVLRHSEATQCTITVRQQPGAVVLTMDNDGVAGVRGSGGPPGGTGLLGLGERVAPIGGTVSAAPAAGGRFVLRVELPR